MARRPGWCVPAPGRRFSNAGGAIVRLDDADLGPGATLEVACTDGRMRPAVACDTPMYDQNREIPRGKLVDIPEIPDVPRA